MLDWLRKLTGKSGALKNPAGVPAPLVKLIADDLAAADKLQPGLGQALLRYVIDGEDEEVLLALASFPEATETLRIQYHAFGVMPLPDRKAKHLRRTLYGQLESLAPPVIYRLARVLDAAWSSFPNSKLVHWPHLPQEARWLDVLVVELIETVSHTNLGKQPLRIAHHLGKVLEAGGHSAGILAELVLGDETTYGFGYLHRQFYGLIDDLGSYLLSRPAEVAAALAHPKPQQRIHALSFLKPDTVPLAGEPLRAVVNLATGSAKTVRDAAEPLLLAQRPEAKDEAAAHLRTKAAKGDVSERTQSIGLLFKLEGERSLPFLQERRQAEKAATVLRELDRCLQVDAAVQNAVPDGALEELPVPEPKSYPSTWELPREVERDLIGVFERYNAKAIELHAQSWARTDPKWRQGPQVIAPPVSPKTAKAIWEALETPRVLQERTVLVNNAYHIHFLHRDLGELVLRHDLDLVPMIRLAYSVGLLGPGRPEANEYYRYRIGSEFVEWVNHYRRHEPDLTLLDLASAFRAAGLDETWVERMYLDESYPQQFNPLHLPDDAIWPFFLKHPKRLHEAVINGGKLDDLPVYYHDRQRTRAYRVLATFPNPPAHLTAVLWEKALGASKAERPLAQACLRNFPRGVDIIAKALEDGRKDSRANAALWLKELNATGAVGAIKKALAKEKHDEPKAAMMEALEALGEDIDKFLNRKKLQEEAEKGLQKGIPADLAWFPLDRLPALHWEKNKQQVPPEVIRWFIVQSFRLKSPEPGPLSRRYFALMRSADRRALGKFVLDAWLTQDTLPRYNRAQAEEEAEKNLAQTKRLVAQYPDYYPNFDENAARKAALNHFLNECVGSASSSKGVLAVAGACCGPDAVPPVERYLKQWYGQRAAQCKALVQMLSWVDHPLAIQLLLSVGTRFRTKSIQQEAARCADLVAERHAWTRDEMADRTVPTAGFERDGTQTIDYGSRAFTARLMEDFSIRLETAEGKVIKDLPAANKLEDEAAVKAAKNDFAASKKELKQVLKFQQERLYEAMCAQRQWRYEDWELYLNAHPIVGRYCARLVWLAFRDNALVASFRPLGDGSLTNVDDEEVALQPDDRIQVAHQAFLDEEDGRRWLKSLKDYEVEPLFTQFGRKGFALDTELGRQTALTEFEGHLVGSYKLRGRAVKLGYTRGQAEDGGWFYTYHKNFVGLKLQAVVEFTGNSLPETDRIVALRSLYFTALPEAGDSEYASDQRPLRLSEVPKVLVSESWNDMKQMADDGTGFDPDWEKKSAF